MSDDEDEDRSKKRKELDLYATLGISRTATDDDIKRAYRHLAQTYHPDKHRTAGLREIAAANFNRIHEAFEILSSPQKRQIYDTYGWAGLTAGMELGPHLRTRDEIRAEFERKERAKAIRDLMEEQRKMGVEFVFGVSAQNLVESGDFLSGLDVLTTGLSSSMPLRIDRKTSTVMGGQVHNRRGVGGGTLMLGVQRQCSPVSALDASVSVGLRSLLSVGGSRYLSSSGNSKGSLSLSWGPRDGSALNVGLERKLAENVRGHWTWTVGPSGGIVTGAHGRHGKWAWNGEVRVGGSNGIGGSVMRQLSEKYQVRATAKAGTTGVFMDIGGVRRLSPDATVSMSVTLGVQGVLLKHRLSYLGYKLSVPMFIVPSLRPKYVVGALLAPPITFIVLERCILAPAARRRQIKLRMENAREVKESLAEAARTTEVMAEAVGRKAAAQEASNGLVILRAVYGDLDVPGAWTDNAPPTAANASVSVVPSVVPSADGAEVHREGAASGDASADLEAAAGDEGRGREASGEHGAAAAEQGEAGSAAGGMGGMRGGRVPNGTAEAHEGADAPEAGATEGGLLGTGRRVWQAALEAAASVARRAGAGAAPSPEADLPPPYMDVTVAVRFLENEGEVFIAGDIEKSGLMGFCDVCPGESKRLRVRYRHNGRLHEVTVDDLEELSIPDEKHAISESS